MESETINKIAPDIFEILFPDNDQAHFVRSAVIFLGILGPMRMALAQDKLDRLIECEQIASLRLNGAMLNNPEIAAVIMHHATIIAQVVSPLIRHA